MGLVIRADSKDVVAERIKRKISETEPGGLDLSEYISYRGLMLSDLFTGGMDFYGKQAGIKEGNGIYEEVWRDLGRSNARDLFTKLILLKGRTATAATDKPVAGYIHLNKDPFLGVRRKAGFIVFDLSELEFLLDWGSQLEPGKKLEILGWSIGMTRQNIYADLTKYAADWMELARVSKIRDPSLVDLEIERLRKRLDLS